MDEAHKDATNTVKETTEGDKLLSHICKVGPNKVSNVKEVMIAALLFQGNLRLILPNAYLYFRVFLFSN